MVAVCLGAVLIAFGSTTAWLQHRGKRRLSARQHVPSDELRYFTARHRRRFMTGCLIAVIGAMIAGAYLTGLEPSIDALTPPKDVAAAEQADGPPSEPKQLTPEQKQLVRMWAFYWGGIFVLAFAVLGCAFADALATRRYWLGQFRVLRDDHEQKLLRDLAVYRAQREQNRMKGLAEADGE